MNGQGLVGIEPRISPDFIGLFRTSDPGIAFAMSGGGAPDGERIPDELHL